MDVEDLDPCCTCGTEMVDPCCPWGTGMVYCEAAWGRCVGVEVVGAFRCVLVNIDGFSFLEGGDTIQMAMQMAALPRQEARFHSCSQGLLLFHNAFSGAICMV